VEDDVDRPHFAADLGFDRDGAEVGEELLHPFFGEGVVDVAGHGVNQWVLVSLWGIGGFVSSIGGKSLLVRLCIICVFE
jgi:hypothetical protein